MRLRGGLLLIEKSTTQIITSCSCHPPSGPPEFLLRGGGSVFSQWWLLSLNLGSGKTGSSTCLKDEKGQFLSEHRFFFWTTRGKVDSYQNSPSLVNLYDCALVPSLGLMCPLHFSGGLIRTGKEEVRENQIMATGESEESILPNNGSSQGVSLRLGMLLPHCSDCMQREHTFPGCDAASKVKYSYVQKYLEWVFNDSIWLHNQNAPENRYGWRASAQIHYHLSRVSSRALYLAQRFSTFTSTSCYW